jgi:hypothetical protein
MPPPPHRAISSPSLLSSPQHSILPARTPARRQPCHAAILATTAVGALAQEQTPLHIAAMRNHPAMVNCLVEEGAEVNAG